jgi:selenocysteine lyase/cysteine desulfurase
LRASIPPIVKLWKAVDGELNPAHLEPLLSARTRLVQVSLVSFYNGHRIDWKGLTKVVRQLAPNALISVDVTQALGRVALDCANADIIISSTHKWTLAVHGGCVIGIPSRNADKLTTHAGGWMHLSNAFDADRFERAVPRTGAASFSVGMPNFSTLYALNASLRYLDSISISAISAHADPLVTELRAGLTDLGLKLMAPYRADRPTGIVAFQHPNSAPLHASLEKAEVHVMHQAGRVRLAVHGYNTRQDIHRALKAIAEALQSLN